jgi:AraC-type transcriptional regulator N-terminus
MTLGFVRAGFGERTVEGSVGIGTMTSSRLAPFDRLLALLDEPGSIPVLASLIDREIDYRLLMSDIAHRLLQTVSVGRAKLDLLRAGPRCRVTTGRLHRD